MTGTVASAYSASARSWDAGPRLIYDRLAALAVDECPLDLAGARVLDLGAGTGAAGRAALRAGARVVAMDAAFGMLAHRAAERPPAAAGDALALPFADAAFDAVIASFSLNHLADPAAGLVEARRVVHDAGALVVTAYAERDDHPVKQAVEEAAQRHGWTRDAWYASLREHAIPLLATSDRALAVAGAAGLKGARAWEVDVSFPELGPEQLVAWRLGLAQLAPFFARLPERERFALRADALARLGNRPPTLVRSIVVLTYRAQG